jgi:hypothetical protein
LVVAGLAALVYWTRRNRSLGLEVSLIFGTFTGLWIFCLDLGRLGQFALGAWPEVWHIDPPGLAAAAAFVSLAVLLVRSQLTKQHLEFLLGLNVVLVVVALFSLLFQNARQLGEVSIVGAALVLILALLWDIATSGELMNVSGRRFPRHARLLLYLGYVIYVASAVIATKTAHVAGGGATGGFDPEVLVQAGLVAFGVPLVLTVFAFSFASLRRQSMEDRSNLEQQLSEISVQMKDLRDVVVRVLRHRPSAVEVRGVEPIVLGRFAPAEGDSATFEAVTAGMPCSTTPQYDWTVSPESAEVLDRAGARIRVRMPSPPATVTAAIEISSEGTESDYGPLYWGSLTVTPLSRAQRAAGRRLAWLIDEVFRG